VSRNQKAPLLAFVLVALVCGLILVDSMRGEALVRPLGVLAPTQRYEHVVPWGREPSATEAPAEVPAEASAAPSPGAPGELPDPFDLTSSDGVSGSVTSPDADPDADGAGPGRDQASVTGDLLDALTATADDAAGSVSGGVPDPAPVTPDPATGPPSTGPPPGVGHGPGRAKNPGVGMANFGPDGGRPEIPVDEAEPTDPADPVDPGAPADAVDESEETLPGAEQPQPRKPHNEARKRDRAKAKGKK